MCVCVYRKHYFFILSVQKCRTQSATVLQFTSGDATLMLTLLTNTGFTPEDMAEEITVHFAEGFYFEIAVTRLALSTVAPVWPGLAVSTVTNH